MILLVRRHVEGLLSSKCMMPWAPFVRHKTFVTLRKSSAFAREFGICSFVPTQHM